jgi:hypothetical protein
MESASAVLEEILDAHLVLERIVGEEISACWDKYRLGLG